MKVLLIEDEPNIASFIKEGLEDCEYEVELAYDGLIGRQLVQNNFYDIIILDIIIPYINGIELCKEIRKLKPQIPVLMLTALNTTGDKIRGFDAGADDYLAKPFEFEELLARIRAITNRTRDLKNYSETIQVADLVMSLENKSVFRGKKRIVLTAREYMLLEFMMKNKNHVFSRSELAEKVWDINFETGTNIVEVYIANLRRKIDRNNNVKLIHTQFGMGYILTDSFYENP